MKKTSFGNGSAFILENFLDAEECQKWLQRAKEVGFEENTPISTFRGPVVNTGVRNNARALTDRLDWAEELWPRIKEFFPSSSSAVAIGLNERFRFYRYTPGQYFKTHLDGSYVRNAEERSLWSLLIYLNDDMEGGETELFWHKVKIKPKPGLLLAFVHRQPHSGNELTKGVKYVLRSDVMFRIAKPSPYQKVSLAG